MELKGWMGPLVGPILAAGAYLKMVKRDGDPVQIQFLLMMMALGLFAGLVVWGFDRMRNKVPSASS